MDFEKYYRMREERERALECEENTLKKEKYRSLKITEIVNEYHYNFISWRDYEVKKYKEWIFTILYVITAIIFIFLIMNPFLSLFWKDEIFFLRTPSASMIILVVTSCLCLVIVYISIIEEYKDLVIERFSHLLGTIISSKENQSTILSCLNTNSSKNKNIRIIKKEWLEITVLSDNKLDFAKEVASWKSIYESSTDARKLNVFCIIVNKNSLVRILSLLIALFSLIAVLVAKTVEPSSIIENIESNFIVLYKHLVALGFSLLILGYEMYYIFPDIKNSFIDYIRDFSRNKEIYVESRFNRFIAFLLLNHTYKINDNSAFELYKECERDSP